jgi:hypothetical protein
MEAVERILVGAVTHPASPPAMVSSEVLHQLERHRLAPLAWDALTTSGAAAAWPEPLQASLRRASAAQALVSELLDAELRRVVAAIGAAGIRAVLVKGAALAYTHYRRPHLRPRSDSDLVIDEADRDATANVLSTLGYVRSDAVDGGLITQQFQWTRVLNPGLVHAVDVHWRVFNPHLFADVLPTASLLARAVAVAALGTHALSPCASDALLLACVHRVAHHAGEVDAIWDFDIHLLVSSLGADDAAGFMDAVTATNMRAVSAAAIAAAQGRFGTCLPPPLLPLLETATDRREPSAVFLEPGRRQVDVLTSDLAALRSWRARARLLLQHLFPSPAYMRTKYGLRNPALLPLAYARRIVAGVQRWLRSQRS